MTAPASYTPPAGSLAARVCNFFRANPEESLSTDDIVCKFDADPADVPDLLLGAVAQGLLTASRRSTSKNTTYSAGPALDGKQAEAELEIPKFITPKGERLPPLDCTKLKIDTGIAVPRKFAPTGHTRYDLLFERLTQPGMSIALPARYQQTVDKARQKYTKRMPGAKYSVRKVSAEQCRVFRLA